uniref:Ig-like domain-containing protein n=1 Tax=Knipowitschia caucasica TaxID=637954 RepID=A0AAV2LN49_KNICA
MGGLKTRNKRVGPGEACEDFSEVKGVSKKVVWKLKQERVTTKRFPPVQRLGHYLMWMRPLLLILGLTAAAAIEAHGSQRDNREFNPSLLHVDGNYEWTSWFNVDHPGGRGDYEQLEAIRFYYKSRVCTAPRALDARTTNWIPARETGEKVHADPTVGFWCLNAEQGSGRNCSNYAVRFLCPKGFASDSGDVDGTWGPWSDWSECPALCGQAGMQHRYRSCQSGAVPCIGSKVEDRECYVPECPKKECSLKCEMGRVNADCDACMCEEHMVLGSVRGAGGLAAEGAVILLYTKLMTISDHNGHFRIPGLCPDGKTTLTVRLQGHAPKNVVVQHSTDRTSVLSVQLQRTEKLHISSNPESKIRREGQTAAFCCKVAGTPPPDIYQWYHNNTLLERESEGTLVLRNLQPDEAGEYYCRASGPSGAIKTKPATLRIIGSKDQSCNPVPEQNLIRLPYDCLQNRTNSLYYDVGKCPPRTCSGQLDSGISGENNEPLNAGEVKVFLDSTQVTMPEHLNNMKLWSLNPGTGLWEEEGSLQMEKKRRGKREERTFLIGNMEIRERRLFNLDVPENRRCYVKVRAFRSERFMPSEQVEGVVISLVNMEPTAGFSTNPRAWGRFDSVITGPNGACLPAFCDEQKSDAYTAFVMANLGGEELEAVPSSPKLNPNLIGVPQPLLGQLNYRRTDHDDNRLKKTAFSINVGKPRSNAAEEGNGPIYAFEGLKDCEEAPFSAAHFRFSRVEGDRYDYNTVPFNEDDPMSWTEDYLSWWPKPMEYRACYIKVKLNSPHELNVRSRNMGGTHPKTVGQLYGLRDTRSIRDMDQATISAVCVEFKCSGMLYDQERVDRTLVKVIPQGSCKREQVNTMLQEYLVNHLPLAVNNDTNEFTMLAPLDPLGHNYGIYTVTDQDPRTAKEIALGRCFDGTSDGTSRVMKSNEGVALTFTCGDREVTRQSVFQTVQNAQAGSGGLRGEVRQGRRKQRGSNISRNSRRRSTRDPAGRRKSYGN